MVCACFDWYRHGTPSVLLMGRARHEGSCCTHSGPLALFCLSSCLLLRNNTQSGEQAKPSEF